MNTLHIGFLMLLFISCIGAKQKNKRTIYCQQQLSVLIDSLLQIHFDSTAQNCCKGDSQNIQTLKTFPQFKLYDSIINKEIGTLYGIEIAKLGKFTILSMEKSLVNLHDPYLNNTMTKYMKYKYFFLLDSQYKIMDSAQILINHIFAGYGLYYKNNAVYFTNFKLTDSNYNQTKYAGDYHNGNYFGIYAYTIIEQNNKLFFMANKKPVIKGCATGLNQFVLQEYTIFFRDAMYVSRR